VIVRATVHSACHPPYNRCDRLFERNLEESADGGMASIPQVPFHHTAMTRLSLLNTGVRVFLPSSLAHIVWILSAMSRKNVLVVRSRNRGNAVTFVLKLRSSSAWQDCLATITSSVRRRRQRIATARLYADAFLGHPPSPTRLSQPSNAAMPFDPSACFVSPMCIA